MGFGVLLRTKEGEPEYMIQKLTGFPLWVRVWVLMWSGPMIDVCAVQEKEKAKATKAGSKRPRALKEGTESKRCPYLEVCKASERARITGLESLVRLVPPFALSHLTPTPPFCLVLCVW